MPISKEQAREEVKVLVEKYNKIVEDKKVNRYKEEDTKAELIEPLFEALGWDVRNKTHKDEVTREEKISKGRVDYSFRINGIPKFFLEAKALKEDLDNPKFVEQAINYAWHKGCTWAVLTDFESVKIFNAEWKIANPFQSHLKTIPCHEFLDRFSELWLLSKESFEQGLIDKEAEKWGKKTKKTPVDKQLLADFTKFRELLSKSATKLNQNKKLTEEELDESIQRILDRLIFIRNCEDKGLEEKTLLSNLREWASRERGQLVKSLRGIFTYFDQQYNSKIFDKHLCDDLDIDSEVLHQIIEGLYYTKDKSVSYDFSAIEADVLGSIYEQYLGHILKKSEKGAKLKESHAHRKAQGIYYTPTYIVDYIVRNTLGELLKNKKVDASKIRVLDPACGSGSFLIKAFDILNEHYAKDKEEYGQKTLAGDTTYSAKERILVNNIFGVDLDKQAVEIAQLNLLLKIAEKGHRLPLLQENIKCGNSLIDDEKVAGDKAFKWETQFKDVMEEGGFDVVIGNPPYIMVTSLNEIDKQFFLKYKTAFEQYNIYYLFIEKAIKVLKNSGLIGFIAPIGFLNNKSGVELRKVILNSCKILQIVDVSYLNVFKDASTYPILFIIQKENKEKSRADNTIDIYNSIEKKESPMRSNQQEILKTHDYTISVKSDSQVSRLLLKIQNNSINLNNIAFNYRGMQINKIELSDEKVSVNKDEYIFPAVHLRDMKGWLPLEPKRFAIHNDKKAGKEKRELFNKEKILIPRFVLKFQASYSGHGEYILDNIYIIQITSKEISTKFVLGLLNSKVMDFYYRHKYSQTHISGGYFAINGKQVDDLPIKLIPQTQQHSLIKLVDKMLSLNKRLNEIGDKKTDERARIEEEIKKTDQEIDELVYKIYGITEKEKKIIEDSLK